MIKVWWIDRGREPQCAPNPDYPDGIDVDLSDGRSKTCWTELRPYPTPRCGLFVVGCQTCGFSAVITTAGRPDDPRSAKLPCCKGH